MSGHAATPAGAFLPSALLIYLFRRLVRYLTYTTRLAA